MAMRKTFFVLFFIFWGIHALSQRVYYGYPLLCDTLQKGDIVIVNLPSINFNRGRVSKWEESDKMVDLFECNKDKILRLEVNFALGTARVAKRLSENFCEDIQKILESKTVLKNYRIIANGNDNPIFLKNKKNLRKSDRYFKMNSRIDIFVE